MASTAKSETKRGCFLCAPITSMPIKKNHPIPKEKTAARARWFVPIHMFFFPHPQKNPSPCFCNFLEPFAEFVVKFRLKTREGVQPHHLFPSAAEVQRHRAVCFCTSLDGRGNPLYR